ncbi:MAG: LytR/AlgR family response regulator transcription factor [Bacteroidia bacterium]
MKVYILDDEPSSIEVLEIYINKYFSNIEIIGKNNNATKAIKEINTLKPDLLFIDVQMPELNGFDVLELIAKPAPLVIFLTAFNQYAIEAIKFSAIYYLVKPLNLQELKSALLKAEEEIKNKNINQNIELLLFNAKNIGASNPKIALNLSDCIEYIPLKNIIRLESDSNYTKVHLTDGRKLIISKTLKDFEIMLENNNFIRVHQSHLINTEHLKKILKNDGGFIQMTDGSEVPVSRSKKEFINKKLELI